MLPQLPERNGAGGGDIQRIDAVGHGDLDRVITGGNGGVGQPVALGAQHDGKLRLGGKSLVVDAHRAVAQGHGRGLKAEGMELRQPLFGPVGGRFAKLRPRHLKHRAHAHPHRATAERVAAGGVDEDGVHVQRRRTAEDRPHVGGIHNAFQHRHPLSVPAKLLHAAGSRAVEGAEHPPRQLKAGQRGQQLPVCGVDRRIPAAGQDLRCRAGDLFALHEQRDGPVSGIQRTGDHLGALGDEDAFFRFQPVPELVLRQAGVGVQLRRVKIGDLDDVRHENFSFDSLMALL